MTRTNALPREHRLKRRRLIRPLFDRARPDVGRIRVGTVLLLHRAAGPADVGAEPPLQVGFAPSRCRTAVERNRVRRALRETFRTNQGPLLESLDEREDTLTLFILYRGRADSASAAIRRDLPQALAKLARRMAGSRNDEQAAP